MEQANGISWLLHFNLHKVLVTSLAVKKSLSTNKWQLSKISYQIFTLKCFFTIGASKRSFLFASFLSSQSSCHITCSEKLLAPNLPIIVLLSYTILTVWLLVIDNKKLTLTSPYSSMIHFIKFPGKPQFKRNPDLREKNATTNFSLKSGFDCTFHHWLFVIS